MVKNCGKGGKGHRKLKRDGFVDHTRMLLFKDTDQNYAIVNDMLGSNRVRLTCFGDNTPRLGIIAGKLRKKYLCRIHKNDIVLVSIRSFQDDKVDIIHVYTDDEKRCLINYQEIDERFCQASSAYETTTNNDDEFDYLAFDHQT
jgi:translation initiation factor 1A